MAGMAGARRPPSWGDVLALSILIGSFLLLGALIFSGGYVHALLDQRAYHTAAVCSQGEATQPCRLHSYATVTGGQITHGKSSTTYWVDVTLSTGATYEGSVNRLLWESLSTGQPVQVEIWNGKLSGLNGVETDSNPDWDVNYSRSLAVGFWIAVGVAFALSAVSYFMWRRRHSALAVAA